MDIGNTRRDANFNPNRVILGNQFWENDFHAFPLLDCMQYFAKVRLSKHQTTALLFGLDVEREFANEAMRNEFFNVVKQSLLQANPGGVYDDDMEHHYGSYLMLELARQLNVFSTDRSVIAGRVKNQYLRELYNWLMGCGDFHGIGLEDDLGARVNDNVHGRFNEGNRGGPRHWETVDSYAVFLWVM
eukprot:3451210-Rhodomonas_salina.1